MKDNKYIPIKAKLLKYTAALVMCSCLLLLTGVNFIFYSADTNNINMALPTADHNASDESTPEKPVEERSTTDNTSIQEEYVHAQCELHNISVVDNALKYAKPDDAKLSIVHFELISPPPDL